MLKHETLKKCFLTSGVMVLVSTFGYLVNMVNQYDSFVENQTEIISAFEG